MATTIESGQDVISFLKAQHRQIKQLFSEVRAATGESRRNTFIELRRLLAIHETAEEEVVHPAARRALPEGEAIVNARLQEENKAKKALSAIEALDTDSPDFDAQISTFAMDVLAHADAEERQEFEPLALSLGEQELERLRRMVEIAERFAPTHPHPGVESQAANLAAGPFAAMVDRARDLLTGKSSANP
jgi:hemerythrin superfamily protein